MTTIVYQKYVARYVTTFTLIEMWEGKEAVEAEITPYNKVAKLNEEEFDELLTELRDSSCEKASWSDGEEEPFDEEDARAADHLMWDEINRRMDEAGL